MTTDFLLWQWSLITQLVSGAMIGGCFLVLAATTRAQRELRSSNDDLLRAQEALRAIVDVDPLTGLANRRALPGILRTVQPDGASLVFIDLRGFKQVNDARGHEAGDDLLKRFAAAVQESFRPGDAVVRYAGDEFLVVAHYLRRRPQRVGGRRAP